MKPVTILDLGINNLRSLCEAIRYVGGRPEITDNLNGNVDTERLVLPGIGSYPTAMKIMKRNELVEPLKQYVSEKRPLLGICLGMQVMLDSSEEIEETKGLGFIPGIVKKLPIKEVGLRIPNIGWHRLKVFNQNCLESSFQNLFDSSQYFYFVHSYMAIPCDSNLIYAHIANTETKVPAIISKEALLGVQFHPEKSGEPGLEFLKKFLML